MNGEIIIKANDSFSMICERLSTIIRDVVYTLSLTGFIRFITLSSPVIPDYRPVVPYLQARNKSRVKVALICETKFQNIEKS